MRPQELRESGDLLFVLDVPEAATPWVRNLASADPVARIKALTELDRQLLDARDAAVLEARKRRPKPDTWAAVGRAAGMSESAAHEHWAKWVEQQLKPKAAAVPAASAHPGRALRATPTMFPPA